MSVWRRKDGRWRVDVQIKRGGKVERYRMAAPTRDAALRAERELRAKLDAGEAVAKKPPLFREWSKEFVEVYATNNNKPSEQRSKLQIVRDHLDPFFGDMRIDRIGYEEIERFKARQFGEKAKPKSINNRLTVLHRLFVIARKSRRIAAVPEVQWLKTPKPAFRFLDFDESSRLLAGVAPEWRPMVLVALRTGLRHGELLALRWEDVDLVGGRVVVRRTVWRGVEGSPKSGREREVPLSNEAREALRALPSRFRAQYVFGPGDVRLTAGETKWPLWTACKTSSVVRCGWHVLRHTFASHLAMRGVSMKAIQELLGHATMAMTMRYAHLSPSTKRDAVDRLDDRFDCGPIAARSGTES